MTISPKLVDRLTELMRRRNRELAFDAALKVSLGIVFSCVTFGLLFWLGWFVGFFVARNLNLSPGQFGAIVTGVFFIAASWSAWRRVNPLAGLKPLSERQLLLTLISQVTPDIIYFSPRHASAGAALVLIAGPANVFEGFAIWAHRLRANDSLVEEAARLLASCQTKFPAEQVRKPAVALLLKRLALIKVVPNGDSAALELTEKGFSVLSGGKAGKGKRTAAADGDR